MKKVALLAIAALVLFGLNSYGQNPDTSRIRIGNKKYTVIVDNKDVRIITDEDGKVVTEDIRGDKKHEHKHKPGRRMNGTWGGFEIGLANFVNSDYKLPDYNQSSLGDKFMDLKVASSWDASFNFAEKSLGIIRNYVGIVTGLGIEYTNYRFVNDFTVSRDNQRPAN